MAERFQISFPDKDNEGSGNEIERFPDWAVVKRGKRQRGNGLLTLSYVQIGLITVLEASDR